MDVVAIVELKKAGEISKLDTDNPQAEVPKSQFVITQVLKGADYIKVGDTFETIYFGEAKKDRAFLAMATDAPNLMWSTPLILTDRAEEYLRRLKVLNEIHADELKDLEAKAAKLAKTNKGNEESAVDALEKAGVDAQLARLKLEVSVKRLAFFQDYLEDEDEMLARDAYDEFAKAPYADVIALKSKMNRDQLISFIENPDVPSNRRRLYFTMLGVCGTNSDAALLESLMRSDDRKKKAGLDALLACHMILTGEQGLDTVDELFLKNKEAEYADTYAAIMAIRFHGSETDIIPRTRLVKSLRHMLDRPELADLVIPDLARWEDWEVMPKLVKLFEDADENSSWVRVPVVNYLRACPLPIAEEQIEALKEIDPDAVKRAMQFFPLKPEKKKDESTNTTKSPAKEDGPASTTSAATANGEPSGLRGEAQAMTSAALVSSTVSFPGSSDAKVAQLTDAAEKPATAALNLRVNKSNAQTRINPPDTLNQVESMAEQGANFWALFGVSLLSGGLCFVAMRSILGLSRQA